MKKRTRLKVGIITFQRSCSYGAFLQCYALQEALQRMGHTVKIIDYQPKHRSEKVRFPLSRKPPFFPPRNLLICAKQYLFRSAIERHLNLTKQQFTTHAQLQRAMWSFDAVICGSDQVWNASHTGGKYDPAYFGDFLPRGVRRISYAASLGDNQIPPAQALPFKELIQRMDQVSVREEEGASEVERVTGRSCRVVPDPTILYQTFGQLIKDDASLKLEPYIFSYQMQQSDLYRAALYQAQQSLTHPVFHLGSTRHDFVARNLKLVTPYKWLSLIQNASHVVTNSFHGAVFALLFNRPLTVVAVQGQMAALTARMRSLLSQMDAPSLLCDTVGEIDAALIAARTINWESIRVRIAQAKDDGEAYLEEALASK